MGRSPTVSPRGCAVTTETQAWTAAGQGVSNSFIQQIPTEHLLWAVFIFCFVFNE